MLLTDDHTDIVAADQPSELRVLPSIPSKSDTDRVAIAEPVVGLFAFSKVLDAMVIV